MEHHEDNCSKNIITIIENIHLLRKLFIIKSTSSSPLHFGQVAIMKTIEQNDNCTQADIAQQLNVTPASVAISTKRLQKAGLITKTIDKNNLRCKRLSITNKGRAAINQHLKILDEYDRIIFKNFSDDEKSKFLEYLERMINEMKKIEGIDNLPDDPIELTMTLHRHMKNFIHPYTNGSDN